MLVYSEVIYSQEVGQPSSHCVPSSTLLCPGAPLYVTVGQLMPSLGGRGHSILRQVGVLQPLWRLSVRQVPDLQEQMLLS